jgi:hypothetical protein
VAQNVLEKGVARLGWLYDGREDTEDRAVSLLDTGSQIELKVPTGGLADRTDPYMRWFAEGVGFGDDPDRSRFQYAPPETLLFHDSDGWVVLVGCRAGATSLSLDSGHGTVVAALAVLGGRTLDYGRVNGLQTRIPALAQWTGFRSIQRAPAQGSGAPAGVRTFEFGPRDEIPIAEAMGLRLWTSAHEAPRDPLGATRLEEWAGIETRVEEAVDWRDHLYEHEGIRRLLTILAWTRLGYARMEVSRDDDPERSLSGSVVAPRWSDIATHVVPNQGDRSRPWSFLVEFDDIGADGVGKWPAVRRQFAQAMEPLFAMADSESLDLTGDILRCGAAIEALGYRICADDHRGKHFNKQGWIAYSQAARHIAEDVVWEPVTDRDEWIKRSNRCYVASKHPDKNLPDTLTLANTLRENLLMMRVWVVSRLGCEAQRLEARVQQNPQWRSYERVY